MLGGSVFRGGRGRPAPTKPNNNEIGLRKILVGAGQGALAPTSCESERLRNKSPAGAGLLVHRLFRGYDLVDRGAYGLCVIPLLIGLVQELVDDARRCSCLIRASCAFLCAAKIS
jgi:hypothetical protein